MDSQEKRQKVLDIITILNDVPHDDAREILEAVQRVQELDVSIAVLQALTSGDDDLVPEEHAN